MNNSIFFLIFKYLAFRTFIIFGLFFSLTYLNAQEENTDLSSTNLVKFSNEYLDIEVIPELVDKKVIYTNDSFRVAFKIKHKSSWHTYWKNPGGPGLPTNVNWELPEGFSTSSLNFPKPIIYKSQGSVNYVYGDVSYLFSVIKTSKKERDSGIKEISGSISWLTCNEDTCIPGGFRFSFFIDLRNKTTDKAGKVDDPRFLTNNLKINKIINSFPINNDKENNWDITSRIVEHNNLTKSDNKNVLLLELRERVSKNILHELLKINDKKDFIFEIFPITEGIINLEKKPDVYIANNGEKLFIILHFTEEIELLDFDNGFSALVNIKNKDISQLFEFSSQIEKEKSQKLSSFINLEKFQRIDTQELTEKHLDGEKGYGLRNNINERLDISESIDSESKEIDTLWIAILLGILGGFILNFMPCVFPIISLKILSFVKQSGHDRKKIVLNGLFYSLGIILSFWILAIIFIKSKSILGDSDISWAFQLQSPGFVLIMASIILILALNLAGVFEFGFLISKSANKLEQNFANKHVYLGAFVSGVLAVVIATPCTGPWMGSAVAFALNNSPFITFTVFSSLAIGFAFPYLALSLFPKYVEKLPKPGAWMMDFKKFLSLPMFITAMWLIWVLALLKPESLIGTLTILLLISVIFWLLGTYANPSRSKKSIIISLLISFILLISVTKVAKDTLSPNKIIWETYTEEKFEKYKGKYPLLLDFTATWCLTCNTNKLAFKNKKVIESILDNEIKLLKIDWTRKDKKTQNLIQKYGRRSIPLNVFYQKNSNKAVILPNILTSSILLKFFNEKQ